MLRKYISLDSVRPDDLVHGNYADGNPLNALVITKHDQADAVLHRDTIHLGHVLDLGERFAVINGHETTVIKKDECHLLKILPADYYARL